MYCSRWLAYLVVIVAFASDARSDPRATGKVTRADIDRIEQKLEDQQHQIDNLIRLQAQYLQQLLALVPDNAGAPRPTAADPPKPADSRTAAKSESHVDGHVDPRPEDHRVVAAKPKPGPKAVGTLVGKITGASGAAFVYVEDVIGMAPGAAVMKQENKQFVPQVLTVPRGTRVEFPNADAVFHNVFSVTPDNSFDLGSYQQGMSKSVTMMHAGVVTVYCNMHPQMVGYILVVPSRLYARAGHDGFYRIPNIPAGHHRVVAWAPNARPVTLETDIGEGDSATLEFELKPQRPGPHTNKDGLPYGSYKD